MSDSEYFSNMSGRGEHVNVASSCFCLALISCNGGIGPAVLPTPMILILIDRYIDT